MFFLQEAVFRNRIFDKPTLLYLHLPRRKCVVRAHKRCDLLKIHYLCGDKDNHRQMLVGVRIVVICSKFITFAVTKTTIRPVRVSKAELWFAQNSLPLRWQRQLQPFDRPRHAVVICSKFITFAVTKTTIPAPTTPTPSCDLLKIHYLCGDKDNYNINHNKPWQVVICSKFITFAVTKTTRLTTTSNNKLLWFAQNSLPLRWQRQLWKTKDEMTSRCDLLKIHYLCGDKDNHDCRQVKSGRVVICSKFITFAVTKTTPCQRHWQQT